MTGGVVRRLCRVQVRVWEFLRVRVFRLEVVCHLLDRWRLLRQDMGLVRRNRFLFLDLPISRRRQRGVNNNLFRQPVRAQVPVQAWVPTSRQSLLHQQHNHNHNPPRYNRLNHSPHNPHKHHFPATSIHHHNNHNRQPQLPLHFPPQQPRPQWPQSLHQKPTTGVETTTVTLGLGVVEMGTGITREPAAGGADRIEWRRGVGMVVFRSVMRVRW